MSAARRYQKTDPGLREHPAFLDLVAELDTTPIVADGLLHGLWALAFKLAPDGDLSRFKARALARAVGWTGSGPKMVDALLEAGFLYIEDDRLLIHDWYEWGGALFKKQESDRLRQESYRKTTSSGSDVTVTSHDVTVKSHRSKNENKNKERAVKSVALAKPSAVFMEWWGIYGAHGSRADAWKLYAWWRDHGASAEDLTTSATNYLAYCTANDRRVMDGRTFLAKDTNRWEEWVSPEPRPNGNGNGKVHAADRLARIAAEMDWED